MKAVHDLPIECMISGDPLTGEGAYRFPHHRIDKYMFTLVFSSGMGWEHLSVSLIKAEGRKIKAVERCPTWEEMCFLKNLFWEVDECCVQYHPPMSDYVSNHTWCLHIWRATDQEIPRPLAVMVGFTNNDSVIEWLKENYPGLDHMSYMRIIYYADASKLKLGDAESEKEFKERIALYFKVHR